MRLPEKFLDEVIARNDIVDVVSEYVHLTPQGANYFGLCPFHSEKTPSFSVSRSKQIYHCFGCSKGGGVISFVMDVENITFLEAVEKLAARVGLQMPHVEYDPKDRRRPRLLELLRVAARFYHETLYRERDGAAAREYLDGRRITKQTATRFGLGAAPDDWTALTRHLSDMGYTGNEMVDAGVAVHGKNGSVYDRFRRRLMLPVIDQRGRVVGFGGRILGDGEPKYLNSPETMVFSKRRLLYGLNLAKNTKRKEFILCEGNIDVITLHQAGFDSAVATMGTALTKEQVQMIARYTSELVICYDNDEAGKKATERAVETLGDSGLQVRILQLPRRLVDGVPVKTDPDDFIKLFGADEFEKRLKGSGSPAEYKLNELFRRFNLNTDDQRVEYLKEAVRIVAGLQSAVEREVYAGRVAESAGVSIQAVESEVQRARKRVEGAKKKKRDTEVLRVEEQRQPKDRALRYANMRSASAEEGIICLLMEDPSLVPYASEKLKPEDFSSEFLAKVYALILEKDEALEYIPPAAVLARLEPGESEHLSKLLQSPAPARGKKAADDYIDVIVQEKLIRAGDLNALAAKYRQTKG